MGLSGHYFLRKDQKWSFLTPWRVKFGVLRVISRVRGLVRVLTDKERRFL